MPIGTAGFNRGNTLTVRLSYLRTVLVTERRLTPLATR